MATHKTLHSLSKRLFELGRMVETNSLEITKNASFAALSTAIRATPVDKGVARSAWWVSLYTLNFAQNSQDVESTSETINKGKGAIDMYSKEGSIFLTNSIHYIKPLDDGSSRQAPAGMSHSAIKSARNVVRHSRLLPKGSK